MDKCTKANLSQTVQCLSVETSDKYVFQPTKDQRIEDLTLALRNFARSCRWREFWHKREIERLNSLNPYDAKFKKPTKDPGLGTGIKPENYKPKGPKGSVELEKVLYTLEAELLKR
eukprot:3533197-Ditylum_brightwellii.AAC.1